ncbi:MAG TPA: hypothetical protein VM182_02425 [Terriglobia bacterium]|nr:hypothetical protein [Terriglobia bacterium]
MRTVKVVELVEDFDLYPRTRVDSAHVSQIAEALVAGATLPPLVVETPSLRIIDGFHRARALRRVYGDEATAEVIEKRCKTPGIAFKMAMELNAAHGRALAPFDRTHCILRGGSLGLTMTQIGEALHMTQECVDRMQETRVGRMRSVGTYGTNAVALKRTVAHMANRVLTKAQCEANGKLSGMQQQFYVNQVILLIENDMLDKENEKLMERLAHLAELLESLVVEV